MSHNAVEAYDDGLKPKSKWTKSAMLSAIAMWCNDHDKVPDENISELRKAELFDRFFEYREWHHTSKFCNRTDFFGIDENALSEVVRDMSTEELAERKHVSVELRRKREEQAQGAYEQAQEAYEQRKASAAFYKQHMYSPDSWAALAEAYPKYVTEFTSRNGDKMLCVEYDGAKYSGFAHQRLPRQLSSLFNAMTDDGHLFD